MCDRSINTYMDQYTILIDDKHKDIITKALEKFAQMHLGQTSDEREIAKKLKAAIAKANHNRYGATINNLTS